MSQHASNTLLLLHECLQCVRQELDSTRHVIVVEAGHSKLGILQGLRHGSSRGLARTLRSRLHRRIQRCCRTWRPAATSRWCSSSSSRRLSWRRRSTGPGAAAAIMAGMPATPAAAIRASPWLWNCWRWLLWARLLLLLSWSMAGIHQGGRPWQRAARAQAMQGRIGACRHNNEQHTATGTNTVGKCTCVCCLRTLWVVGITLVLLGFPATPHSVHHAHHHPPLRRLAPAPTCAPAAVLCGVGAAGASSLICPPAAARLPPVSNCSRYLQGLGQQARRHIQEAEHAQHSRQWRLAAAAANQTNPLPSVQNLTASSSATAAASRCMPSPCCARLSHVPPHTHQASVCMAMILAGCGCSPIADTNATRVLGPTSGARALSGSSWISWGKATCAQQTENE